MRHCLQYPCHPGIGDSRYPGSRTLVPGTTAVRTPSVRGPGSPLRYGRDDRAEVSRKHTNRPTYRRINAPLPPIPMSSRNRRQAISGISYAGARHDGRANLQRARSRLSASLRPGRQRRGFPEAHEQTNAPTHQCAIASNTNVIPESATGDIRDLVRWCPARRPCESPACEVPALRFATAGTTGSMYAEIIRSHRRTDAPTSVLRLHLLPIDLAAMADTDDQDDQAVVLDLRDDAP
jgi:hypothetical protein